MKTALDTVSKLERDYDNLKAKAEKYKEIAARGHRMGEKRASMCVQQIAPSNEALIQTQHQLERERTVKAELMKKMQEMEDDIRKSECNFNKRLEVEERRWISKYTERESEFQEKIFHLEDKIVKEKENRIKVFNSFKSFVILIFITIY